MASYINLILDTTAPAGVSLALNGNAAYASSRDITATIGTTDDPTTGYQMKIWGDVDTSANASIQTTEAASAWIALTPSQAVRLSTGDALKSINVRVRDDVDNESTIVTKTITLDATAPTVTVQPGSPTAAKISEKPGKNTTQITWQSDEQYQAYEVAVVASGSALRGSGTVIGSANGSVNVSGTGLTAPAATNVTTTVTGTDLKTASSADGIKVLKVFVQDMAGNWSTV